jgi:hypothetical protein
MGLSPSFHESANNTCIEAFLTRCRREGWKINNAYWVIDNVGQIESPMAMMKKWCDVIKCMRIKAASNLWAEQRAGNRVFTSDMLKYLLAKPDFHLRSDLSGNRTSEAYVECHGMLFALVSWYDRFNVDLDDINCGPWYRAKNGEVHDLVYSCLINEGMAK